MEFHYTRSSGYHRVSITYAPSERYGNAALTRPRKTNMHWGRPDTLVNTHRLERKVTDSKKIIKPRLAVWSYKRLWAPKCHLQPS